MGDIWSLMAWGIFGEFSTGGYQLELNIDKYLKENSAGQYLRLCLICTR